MLEQARELAARGHYPLMIEAVLRATGFPEAGRVDLKDIAERARKEAVGLSTERARLRLAQRNGGVIAGIRRRGAWTGAALCLALMRSTECERGRHVPAAGIANSVPTLAGRSVAWLTALKASWRVSCNG